MADILIGTEVPVAVELSTVYTNLKKKRVYR